MLNVIIAGGRDYNDYDTLKSKCDLLLKNSTDVTIVCGGAKGADSLGFRYAKERGFKVKIFRADWDTFGKSAGYKRNVQMGDYADCLIAFWDKQSRGTKHMIDIANERKLNVRIIYY